MLKTLLNKALAAALEQQERTLTPKLWEQHAETPQKLTHMLREIREGEKAIEEDETHLRDLRALLGVESVSSREEPPKADPVLLPVQSASSPSAKGRRVGQRSAKRDPIGKETHHAQ
jgi:hypothetical protein